MNRRAVLFVGALSAALSLVVDVYAAASEALPEHEVVYLYNSNASCAAQSKYVAAVQQRLTSPRLVAGGEASVLQVSVAVSQDSTEAVLTLLLSDGSTLTRSIEAASCEEAIEAIAFVTAVALDSEATGPVPIGNADPGKKAVTKSVRQNSKALQVKKSSPVSTPLQPKIKKELPFAALAAAFQVTRGPVPATVLGIEIAGLLGLRGGGLWSPSLRLGASYQRGAYEIDDVGGADFELIQAAIDLCPSEWRSTGRDFGVVSFRPCVEGVFGASISEGRDLPLPQSAVRPWVQVGIGGRGGFDLSQSWTISLGASLGFPLIRDTFQFEDVDFYEVPIIVGSWDVGIELRYW